MTVVNEAGDAPRPLALDLTTEVPPLVDVRRWAGEVLHDLTEDELGDCLLVVTELVANAYDHGTSPRRVRVERTTAPCAVRVEVDDGSLEEVVLGESRFGDHRGRGLVIVANLAAKWGVDHHSDGKTVWAEVSCGTSGP